MSQTGGLPVELAEWLAQHAPALDAGHADGDALPAVLARHGLVGVGVPVAEGGAGGSLGDAIEAVSAVAWHSLTAAFVLWAQRTFVAYLQHTDQAGLAGQLLPELLAGRTAGATGLSNAIKFLGGVEALQVRAREQDGGWRLDGRLPWVTNLARSLPVEVAIAVQRPDGGAAIVTVPVEAAGVTRSADLPLIGLQSSNTAALSLNDVPVRPEGILDVDARAFVGRVRPTFLGLQCGLSIGLARRALHEARAACARPGARSVLVDAADALAVRLQVLRDQLVDGVVSGAFQLDAVPLFKVRLALAAVVAEAVWLELQASGGAAYLDDGRSGFARRWREAAFVPVVTPSLAQLRQALQSAGVAHEATA